MTAPRPLAPSTMRLVSASVAAIAALGVVALGVRLGTDGLGSAPARNPASATATPAAAVVDRARPAGSALEQAVLSTLADDEATATATAVDAPAAPAGPTPAPTPADAPPPAPAPAPEPAPAPDEPVAPLPDSPVPLPVDPEPVVAPVEETVDTLVDAVSDLGLGL